jgi:hypothetical protein
MGDALKLLHIQAAMCKTLSHMLTCMIVSLLCCKHIHESESLCAFTDCRITFPYELFLLTLMTKCFFT